MPHSLGQGAKKGQEIGHPDSLTSARNPGTGPSLEWAAQLPGHSRAPAPSPAPSPPAPHAVQPRVQSLPSGCMPHAGICGPYGASSELHPHFPPLPPLRPPNPRSPNLLARAVLSQHRDVAIHSRDPQSPPAHGWGTPGSQSQHLPSAHRRPASTPRQSQLGYPQHPSPVWH